MKESILPLLLSLAISAKCFALPAAYDVTSRPNDTHESVISGMGVVPPAMIARFVRQMIAKKLNANLEGASIRFKTPSLHPTIQIPENDLLLAGVLRGLGIAGSINANISPVDVEFKLPASALQIRVRHLKPGLIGVHASWQVTQLSATSERLHILVPKGIFDEDFSLDATPVTIGLKKDSPAIQVSLDLEAMLSPEGTTIKLIAANTNLNDDTPAIHPQFTFPIGPLTVNGSPLQLEIDSNGQKLQADDVTIRQQLERLEPQFTATLRKKIDEQVQEYFKKISASIDAAPPFKIHLNTNEIIQKPGTSQVVAQLLSNIDAEFNFSSLEYSTKERVFFSRIASHLCIDQQCLFNSIDPWVKATDLAPLTGSQQVGMVIYESWIQSVIGAELIQKRLRDYYDAQVKAPGVSIGKEGVSVHLNPDTKSIDTVFNLSIDIKKTAPAKDANTSWKRFLDKAKKVLGGTLESIAGSGKRVIIPVEVRFSFAGLRDLGNGKSELVLKTTLPFHDDGTLTNTYHAPSNVDQMTSLVRKSFMDAIRDTFKDVIPPEIRIPVPSSISLEGIELPLKNLMITQDHALLLTAEVSEVMK